MIRTFLRVLRRDGVVAGIAGVVLAPIVGYWLWQSSRDELAMMNHAKTVRATLISTAAPTHVDPRDGDYGVEGEFSFLFPDGTEGRITRGYDHLDDIPEFVQVEYLPEKPEVRRIKGTGNSNVGAWKFWLGFKYALVAFWFAASIWLGVTGVRNG